jgi:c(7)-type cytochrome triheme protein
MPKILLYVFIILFFFPSLAVSKENQKPELYKNNIPAGQNFGIVKLNNFSKKAGVAPVVFDHWLHRAKFTCRICHVDIGFAMKAQVTNISAADNINGYYCGSCHDGKKEDEGKKIFASCTVDFTEEEGKRCVKCHSEGKAEQRQYDFKTFTKNLPRLRGDLIDWEKAETEGKIKPKDFLEGVSYKREPLKAQEDFSIEARTWKMSDVIFSHKKHTVWNGCEVCHPLIFPSSKKGTVQYSMFEIMEGEYCGACHVSVAFSVWLCYKCHKDSVR